MQANGDYLNVTSPCPVCQQIGPTPRESLEHGAASQTSDLPDRNYWEAVKRQRKELHYSWGPARFSRVFRHARASVHGEVQ